MLATGLKCEREASKATGGLCKAAGVLRRAVGVMFKVLGVLNESKEERIDRYGDSYMDPNDPDRRRTSNGSVDGSVDGSVEGSEGCDGGRGKGELAVFFKVAW